LRPGVQRTREQAALGASLLIGAQLLLGYWFYSYLTWCYPLLVIAIIRARSGREAADTSALASADWAAGIRTVAALRAELPPVGRHALGQQVGRLRSSQI